MKQNALQKEFLSLSRFLTERQQSRPLSRVRSTLNTQDIFNDKTQTDILALCIMWMLNNLNFMCQNIKKVLSTYVPLKT